MDMERLEKALGALQAQSRAALAGIRQGDDETPSSKVVVDRDALKAVHQEISLHADEVKAIMAHAMRIDKPIPEWTKADLQRLKDLPQENI